MAFQWLFSGHICHYRVALVVACDFERSIESSSGGVVQQSIAHQVQDVLEKGVVFLARKKLVLNS